MKKFFISSTFKDMHYERDILHERVFPEINSYAMQYGEKVAICDLRWGVNTEDMDNDSSARKVLSVCMDAIDSSSYMIVLLGQRYGWIPSRDVVQMAAERGGLDLDSLEKSITALEIEYGALKCPENAEKVFFYFRENIGQWPVEYGEQDSESAHKLCQLKERIRSLSCGHIRTYQVKWDNINQKMIGMDRFADMVISDITKQMKGEWESWAKLTEDEKKRRIHWNLAKEKFSRYIMKKKEAGEVIGRLNFGERFLLIQGEMGSGKSTLAGYLTVKLQEQGWETLPVFCGREGSLYTAQEVAIYILRFLEDLQNLDHFQPVSEDRGVWSMLSIAYQECDGIKWQNCLTETALRCCKSTGKKVVLIIDGVDELSNDGMRRELLFVPHCLSDQIRVVMTCTEKIDIDTIAIQKEVHVNLFNSIMWKQFNKVEIRGVLNLFLKNQGRELSDKVKEKIVSKEESSNSLYLRLLLHRLSMMNKYDFKMIDVEGGDTNAISNYLGMIVDQAPKTLVGILWEIFSEASRRLGIGSEKKAILYIALSEHGLREQDLYMLMSKEDANWNSLKFALFMKYLHVLFIKDDNERYTISNEKLKQGIMKSCPNKKLWHGKLLEYLRFLPDKDVLKMEEIAWQCFYTDNTKNIVEYITYSNTSLLIEEILQKEFDRISKLDGGKWIFKVIREATMYGADIEFVRFFSYFCQVESIKKYFFSERAGFLEKMVDYLEGLIHEIDPKEKRIEIIREWEKILTVKLSIYSWSGDEVNGKLCYEKRLKLYRALLKKNIGEEDKIEVAEKIIESALLPEDFFDTNCLEEGSEILENLKDFTKETLKYKETYSKLCVYKAMIRAIELCNSRAIKRADVYKISKELNDAAEQTIADGTGMLYMILPIMYLISGYLLVTYIGIGESTRTMELYIKATECNEVIKEKQGYFSRMYLENKTKIYEGISSLYEQLANANSSRLALFYCKKACQIYGELIKWDFNRKSYWTGCLAGIILRMAKIYGRLETRRDIIKSGKYYHFHTEICRKKVKITKYENDYFQLITALADEGRHPTTSPRKRRRCAEEILKINDIACLKNKKKFRKFIYWAHGEIYLIDDEKYELANKRLDDIKLPFLNPYKKVKDPEMFLKPMVDAAEKYGFMFHDTHIHRKYGGLATLLLDENVMEVIRDFTQRLLSHRVLLSDGYWKEDVTFYADYAFYLAGLWKSSVNLEYLEIEPDHGAKQILNNFEIKLVGAIEYILDWNQEEVMSVFSNYENKIYDQYMLPSITAWPDKISVRSSLTQEEKETYTTNAIRLFVLMTLTAEMYIIASRRMFNIGIQSSFEYLKIENWGKQVVKKIFCHYKYLINHGIYLPKSAVEELQNLDSFFK